MKKENIFALALIVISIMLFLFSATGLAAHIAISVVGIVVLAAYTAMTKKDWDKPALEIIMRVCYGLTLISGIVIKVSGELAPVCIAHKVLATVFVVLLVVLMVLKQRAKKA